MGSIGVSQAGSIGVNKGSIGVLSQYQSIGVSQDPSGTFGVNWGQSESNWVN